MCILMYLKNCVNGYVNGEIMNKLGKFLLFECIFYEKNCCEMYC